MPEPAGAPRSEEPKKPKVDVRVIPFDPKYLDETLAMMKQWSPDHPELGERSLYDWQQCARYLALYEGRVVGQIGQIDHEYRYADGRPPVHLGWGITLVLDMSNDDVRKAAGRQLLKACEDAPGLRYAAVGVVPLIEPAYLRRGHQLGRDSCRYFGRFFNPSKILSYWHKSPALAPFLSAVNLAVRPRTTLRYGTIEKIAAFRPEWDATWDALQKQRYELYGVRTADYLNYKLAQPNRTYLTCLHRDASGTIDGYIVYRRAHHRVKDLDLVKICAFVGSQGARRDLFAEAMRYAMHDAKGTYGIVALSSAADAADFRHVGMWVERPYPIVVAAGVEGRLRIDFFDSDLDDLW